MRAHWIQINIIISLYSLRMTTKPASTNQYAHHSDKKYIKSKFLLQTHLFIMQRYGMRHLAHCMQWYLSSHFISIVQMYVYKRVKYWNAQLRRAFESRPYWIHIYVCSTRFVIVVTTTERPTLSAATFCHLIPVYTNRELVQHMEKWIRAP